MTIRLVHRPARRTTALMRPDDVELAPPPQLPDGAGTGLPIQALLPIIGAMSSVTMIVVLRANPLMVVVGAVILVVALVGGLVSMFSQRGGASRRRLQQRERYIDYLEETRGMLQRRSREALRDARLLLPPPADLLGVVVDPARRWERRRHDADFLMTRVGVGTADWFGLELREDPDPVQPQDPALRASAAAVVRECSGIHGMPTGVRLDRAGDVTIVGPREQVVETARAMIAQLVSLHAPEDLQLGLVFGADRAADWECLSTAPHLQMDATFDGPVHARRVAPDITTFADLCRTELADRHTQLAASQRAGAGRTRPDVARLVVFVDAHGAVSPGFDVGPGRGAAADLGITVVHLVSDRLHEPAEVTARIAVHPDASATITDTRDDAPGGSTGVAVLDRAEAGLVEAISRTLCPLRLVPPSAADADERQVSIPVTQLLGIGNADRMTPEELWTPRSQPDFLTAPIGVDERGAPVHLDLKESAQGGMGPHGICIGATGSGKSELLRTLILGLALSHSPDDVSMVLVDFKGGATFAPFKGLPHVAGIIDNLEADPQMIERARSSIAGEVVRRQQVLKDTDDLASIGEYRALRRERPELPALPHLFLVIDEFGELLTAEPEFVQLLLTIGRIGRSIGVHLLLSSQRIEAGRLRGLDTYLSYRLGLRTFSESESSIVLGNHDAYLLPSVPGYGILKVDTTVYRRFRAGYVSGPATESAVQPAPEETPDLLLVPVFNGVHEVGTGQPDPSAVLTAEAAEAGPALVDACVRRLRGTVPATRPVWLSPLPERFSLSKVLGGPAPAEGELRVAMGLIDDPAQQRQEPWWIDLSHGGGHLAVLGAPQSGRSTFLRTLAASLALTRTPREVGIYGMDLTGGGLARLEGFPHVGGVATRSDRVRLRRLAEELTTMLTLRESLFALRGIDSLAMMRREHAAGRLPELASADIVLLLDGLSATKTDFEELEPAITQLLQRGGSYGMHVVVSTGRWADFRIAQQSLVGTKFELRINDPAESVIGRKVAETMRAAGPGRLITEDRLKAQVALPVLDDIGDDSIGDALEALAERVRENWSGPAAAPIRLLPDVLSPRELPDVIEEPDAIPLGLRQDTMTPALFEFTGADQHLIVFGDAGSGKTTVLRGIIDGFVERYTADELVIAVMDVRGRLAAGIPDDFLGGHAANARDAQGLAAAIADELLTRQLEKRTATSPRVVVVVDDFDLLSSGTIAPLTPLLEHLPASRDLKLHILLTRPVAGAARAAYDPTLQGLRDTGGSGLVMSGERSEGQLWPGVYAEALVPGRGHFVRRGQRPRLIQVARFGGEE